MEIHEIRNRYKEELNLLEKMVNGSANSVKNIGKAIPYHFHNTLEQNFFRLVVAYIKEVATTDRLFSDARNEETHRLCKKIYRLMKENDDDLEYVSLPFF